MTAFTARNGTRSRFIPAHTWMAISTKPTPPISLTACRAWVPTMITSIWMVSRVGANPPLVANVFFRHFPSWYHWPSYSFSLHFLSATCRFTFRLSELFTTMHHRRMLPSARISFNLYSANHKHSISLQQSGFGRKGDIMPGGLTSQKEKKTNLSRPLCTPTLYFESYVWRIRMYVPM